MALPIVRAIAAAVLAAPLMANAVVYQFNANLNAANEVGTVSMSTATGIATLFYNDVGTASLLDDTYDFSMAVFGLSGGTVSGTAASAFHIHGAASTSENAGVRVFLDAAPFVALNSGSVLLVGGSGISAPSSFAGTPATATRVEYPAMSFLDMLVGGLAYVNVHTAADSLGAVRGQLVQVTAVPEPATVAMLAAGLGLVGAAVRRQRKATARST